VQSERKSFLLYFDWLENCAYLGNEEFGQLIRVIAQYAQTGDVDIGSLPERIEIAFGFMRGQLDRDKEKYERRCETSRENGKKGGRPPKQQPPADGPFSNDERFQQLLALQAAYESSGITKEEYEAKAKDWGG